MTTKALSEVLECKRTHYCHMESNHIIKEMAPIIMNAFKTKKFLRPHAVKVAAAILALIEHFDGECDQENEHFDTEIDDIEIVDEPTLKSITIHKR